MHLLPNTMFHIYNRGNNRDLIFYTKYNYEFFLKKVDKQLSNHLDILAYCLMPNHFHLMVQAKPDFARADFTNSFRILLSSYTRAINNQENRTGSLFQQNSKAKNLELEKNEDYPFLCFNYIHQNPLKAGIVRKMEDWKYSSFVEFMELTSNSICNKDLTREVLDLPKDKSTFLKMSYEVIDEAVINNIY